MLKCPLCSTEHVGFYSLDPLGRDVLHCPTCYLNFVNPTSFLSLEDQKSRYDFHQNTLESSGYIDFLNRCILPTLPFLEKGWSGLDYGSGPGSEPDGLQGGSVLSILMKRDHGMFVDCYDPVYSPKTPGMKWEEKNIYDFVFSTEVWEHFTEPEADIRIIQDILKPRGVLAVMTTSWDENTDFSRWHYAKDDTHVCFYHGKTMEWIALNFKFIILYTNNKNVWVFQKKSLQMEKVI